MIRIPFAHIFTTFAFDSISLCRVSLMQDLRVWDCKVQMDPPKKKFTDLRARSYNIM